MSAGFEGAFGVAGAQDSLQKILAQRMLERKLQEAQQQQQFENTMQSRRLGMDQRRMDQTDQERKDALAETTRQHDLQDQEKRVGLANALGDQIPQGTFMPPTDPAVGMLRTGGRSSLLQPQDERPAVETGPLQPGDTGAARQQGFIKRASFNQVDKTADNERQSKATAEQAARDAEAGRHNRAMENKPTAEAGWTVQQGMVNGKPGWIRINSRTGDIHAIDANELTPKPSAQETQHATTTKETLDTLSQLDQAIENAKELIGPGAGRVSNLEQMVGSADPRVQALGVKMKAAKMRVDHALTGSVRAGASPMMMQQWDNILANKVTPEGLKAGVQAMREILGGGAAGGGLPDVGGTFQGGKVLKVEKVQ